MTTVTEISIVGDRVGDIYHFVVDVGDGRDICRDDRRRWIVTTETEVAVVGDSVGDNSRFVVDVGDRRDISREDRRRWIVAVNFRDVDLWIAVAVLLGRVRRLD